MPDHVWCPTGLLSLLGPKTGSLCKKSVLVANKHKHWKGTCMQQLFQTHGVVPAAVQARGIVHLGAALFAALFSRAAPLRLRRMRQAGKRAGGSGACCSWCNFLHSHLLTLD